MRILWCHEVSYLSKPVYEYQDFAERLAGRGHSVEVIDFDESTAHSARSESLSRTGEGEVLHTPIPHGNVPVLKYAEARWRFRRMLEDRLEKGGIDVVFVYSVFINGTEAIRLARRYGVPVVYRVLDAYHRLRPGAVTRAILKLGERYIYRNATQVLATNERMKDYALELSGVAEDSRFSVLDHGVDTDHFRPAGRDPELSRVMGISESDPVLLFLGTTYGFSGLGKLIARMPELQNVNAALKLVILGAGELDGELHRLVGEHALERSVFLPGMISYADLPRYLSLATIALNPFEINAITKDIVPIKILQYQACGLPVVSSPLPDLMRKHPENESGVVYSSTDGMDDFVGRLLSLINSGDGDEIGSRGLRYVSSRYSVDSTVDRLERTLSSFNKEG